MTDGSWTPGCRIVWRILWTNAKDDLSPLWLDIWYLAFFSSMSLGKHLGESSQDPWHLWKWQYIFLTLSWLPTACSDPLFPQLCPLSMILTSCHVLPLGTCHPTIPDMTSPAPLTLLNLSHSIFPRIWGLLMAITWCWWKATVILIWMVNTKL